ncbi:MAG: hypothetical protein F7B17_08870 [Desulfurococcales archaeon]|nr:hypothetical protein [Desulfurococcales archaeon]
MEGLEVLAFKLAVLTFHLGVIVYALPIPVRFVKKWAPALIYDSLLAIALISIYRTLYAFSGFIADLGGGSWHLLSTWAQTALAYAAVLKAISMIVDFISDKVGLSKPLASLLSGVAGDLAYTIVVLIVFITALTQLALRYGSSLLLVGLILYSIPFRITKPAGAWIISFVLVFNAGLPLMPVFLEAVGDPDELSLKLEYNLASINVVGANGDPLPAGQLWIYSGNELIAIYPILDGKATSIPEMIPIVALPLSGELRIEVVHMATRFKKVEPSIINASELGMLDSIQVKVPAIIWAPVDSLMLYSTSSVGDSEEWVEGGWRYFKAKIILPRSEFSEVLWHFKCDVKVNYMVVDGSVETDEGLWKWKGAVGRYLYLEALEDSVVEVTVGFKEGSCPDLERAVLRGLKDYRAEFTSLFDYLTVDIIKLILIYYITLPFAYISILFIATTSLAKVLGGGPSIKLRLS